MLWAVLILITVSLRTVLPAEQQSQLPVEIDSIFTLDNVISPQSCTTLRYQTEHPETTYLNNEPIGITQPLFAGAKFVTNEAAREQYSTPFTIPMTVDTYSNPDPINTNVFSPQRPLQEDAVGVPGTDGPNQKYCKVPGTQMAFANPTSEVPNNRYQNLQPCLPKRPNPIRPKEPKPTYIESTPNLKRQINVDPPPSFSSHNVNPSSIQPYLHNNKPPKPQISISYSSPTQNSDLHITPFNQHITAFPDETCLRNPLPTSIPSDAVPSQKPSYFHIPPIPFRQTSIPDETCLRNPLPTSIPSDAVPSQKPSYLHIPPIPFRQTSIPDETCLRNPLPTSIPSDAVPSQKPSYLHIPTIPFRQTSIPDETCLRNQLPTSIPSDVLPSQTSCLHIPTIPFKPLPQETFTAIPIELCLESPLATSSQILIPSPTPIILDLSPEYNPTLSSINYINLGSYGEPTQSSFVTIKANRPEKSCESLPALISALSLSDSNNLDTLKLLMLNSVLGSQNDCNDYHLNVPNVDFSVYDNLEPKLEYIPVEYLELPLTNFDTSPVFYY